MFSRTLHGLTLIGLISLCGRTYSQLETENTVAKLVSDLGHVRFETREQASRQLLVLGPQILEELKQLSAIAGSKEVQLRAASIQSVLERKKLASLAQAFLTDANEKNAHGLPGWHLFREQLGGSRVAKEMFLEAIHSQYEIMTLIDSVHGQRNSSQDSVPTQNQLVELTAIRSNLLLEELHQEGRLGLGDSVAMLLSVAAVDQPASYEVSQYIRTCTELRFSGNLNRQGVRSCLMSLLGNWIPKSPESMAPDVLRIGRELDQTSVLPIARRYLSKAYDPNTREQAIICICKYGELRDVDMLLKYAEDTTVVDKYFDLVGDDDSINESRVAPPGFNTPSINIPQKLIRVNDLAVISAMKLLRADPVQVFPNYNADRFMTSWRTAVAVPESEQQHRDEMIAAWLAASGRSSASGKVAPIATPIPDDAP